MIFLPWPSSRTISGARADRGALAALAAYLQLTALTVGDLSDPFIGPVYTPSFGLISQPIVARLNAGAPSRFLTF